MNKRYNNYHKHTHYSNVSTLDCLAKPIDYINRAKELGHTTYFTTEHGNAGNIFEAHRLCNENGIKPIYGAEVYYADDINIKKSRTVYHLVLIAMTNSGRKQINKIISKGYKDGFYYKARVDLKCLLSLNPKDIVVTTACIASRLFKEVKYEIEYFDLTEEEREILKEKGIFRNLYGNADEGYYELEKDILDGNLSKEEAIIINKPYESYIIDYRVLPSKKRNVIKESCVSGWLDEFFLPVFNHFKENLYLEVQNHTHPKQIEYNKMILELHKEYGVKLIHANDSHYIRPEDSRYRDMFLKAKDIRYPEEEGFILDYPDYDTVVKRYREQGILNDEEIKEALESTLVFDNAEPIDLNYDFKLPKIFDGDSKKHLKRILLDEFKNKIPFNTMTEKEIKKYKEALNYEYKIITKCDMEDYFLLDYYIVKKAVNEYGGILTRTGRGSAVSFLINYLLGFTQIDRLKSPIKLYPTRFMSAERILSSRSLPDIDLNWANVDPVLKASKDYLGEDGVYYMVSYKPMQESSAFRLWCKALDMNISEYNDIAKNIDSYKEDPKWKPLIDDSKVFMGVIESISPSPCSVLLLDKPISEEIGLIKVGDVMCCALDGYYCDTYKYLKNDYLVVSVYTLINETYKLIGRQIDDIETLLQNCDDKVWNLFAKGLTTTINQCDSDYDKQILKKYRPSSLAEMSAYVAAIRPGFASLLNNFVERKPYSTGVKQLDELLSDSFSYLIYQESIMSYLTWLGIEEKETYDIIKKISKKKFKQKELDELKDKLYAGWMKQVGEEKGFHETWEVVEAASRYSFNASHSLSVALDALYGAYLKSHYPLEYFTVALTEYSDDEIRTNNLISELDYFNIELRTIKFRKSTFNYLMDKETNSIYKGLESIKFISKRSAQDLYELGKNNYDSFIELLSDIKYTSVDSRQLLILISLDFFSEFGEPNTLLKQVEVFNSVYGKKTAKKKDDGMVYVGDYCVSLEEFRSEFAGDVLENGGEYKESAKQIKGFDSIKLCKIICNNITYPPTTVLDKINYEKEYLGYITTFDPSASKKLYYVSNLDKKKSIVNITLYEVYTGKSRNVKMWTNEFNKNPFEEKDVLTLFKIEKKLKRERTGEIDEKTGKQIYAPVQGSYEFWLKGYSVDRGKND